jgi:signal peptidase I
VTQPDINGPENELAPDPRPVPQKATAHASFTSAAWELVQTVVLALVLFLLIRNVIQNFRIDGISMEPNFHNGQFLIVNRFAYCPGLHLDISPLNIHWEKTWCIRQPKRGDVIVFEYPKDLSRDFIKRVIGLPGETIEVRGGKIYINGQLMPEPFGPNPRPDHSGPFRGVRDGGQQKQLQRFSHLGLASAEVRNRQGPAVLLATPLLGCRPPLRPDGLERELALRQGSPKCLHP